MRIKGSYQIGLNSNDMTYFNVEAQVCSTKDVDNLIAFLKKIKEALARHEKKSQPPREISHG